MAITTKNQTVSSEQEGRIDRVVQMLTGLSRKKVRGLFDHGCISLNGAPCADAAAPVEDGDEVATKYDPAQGYPEKKKSWQDRAFTVLYEDEHLIVVNKDAMILTTPTNAGESYHLVDRVSRYLNHSRRNRMAYVVHRLDRGVSGALIMAKNSKVCDLIKDELKKQKVERTFIAIVHGRIREEKGTLKSSIETKQFPEGDEAITHYTVKKRLKDTTVIEIKPETLVRNQIRIQLAEAGHAILGDIHIGTKDARHADWKKHRLALHSRTVKFKHPLTQKPLSVDAPVSVAIRAFMKDRPEKN